jgi:hypothetical protein
LRGSHAAIKVPEEHDVRVLNIDPDALGPIVVRDVPEQFVDQGTGEVRYRGRVIVPGLFQPQEIRVRTSEPYSGQPGPVTAHGACRVTSWYQPRNRGVDARSEITLTCDELRPTDQPPNLVGRDLPALFPSEVMLLAHAGDRVNLMLPPGQFDADGGVVELTIPASAVADGCLPGAMVRVLGVTGRVQLVDREDAGRYAKARVTLAAQRLEPVAATIGRGRREPSPVPAPEGEAA